MTLEFTASDELFDVTIGAYREREFVTVTGIDIQFGEFIKYFVQFLVGDAKLGLICLTVPEIGCGGFIDDLLGDAEDTRHLPDFRLVKMPDRFKGASSVTMLGEVTNEEFSAITGADDQGSVFGREVIEDDHAESGADIAFAQGVDVCSGKGEIRVCHVADLYRFGFYTKGLGKEGRVSGAIGMAGLVG